MTSVELNEIVEQRMGDPTVLGRIVCNLRQSDTLVQRHHDENRFCVAWQDAGDYWRCTVVEQATGRRLTQVDIHENATLRIEADAPCRITVSPEDDILSITRYR